jgi:AcrR family transcriptional regulator
MATTVADLPPSGGSPSTGKPERIDGRHLRSERTKRLIIEAYLTLVRESSPRVPTAAEIAERAGYSVRSVFERFPDLQALRVAATDLAIADARANYTPRDLDADRATRLRTQLEIRGRGCDHWLPMWRVLNANSAGSAELQERIKLTRALVLKRIEQVFQPELSTLSDAERNWTVLAIEALTDFESWARMREFFSLSFDEACAVWIRAIDRLLPPTPAGAS